MRLVAAARLVCKKLSTMMFFSPSFGCVCSVAGLYFSWAFNLPVGGTIVLTMIAGFMMIAATMGVRSAVTA
ncbi:metal ABC transporter permease [Rothia terrae]|nr:metal ABC transporter permease [Rothia terrae]